MQENMYSKMRTAGNILILIGIAIFFIPLPLQDQFPISTILITLGALLRAFNIQSKKLAAVDSLIAIIAIIFLIGGKLLQVVRALFGMSYILLVGGRTEDASAGATMFLQNLMTQGRLDATSMQFILALIDPFLALAALICIIYSLIKKTNSNSST